MALFEDHGFSVERVVATYKAPNLFHVVGWNHPTARHYSRKLLRKLPFGQHLIESQYMVAARLTTAAAR